MTARPAGGVYVGSGVRDGARRKIYKFMPTSECVPCDMDCDGDINAFRAYRCKIDYPIYGSQVAMAFDPPAPP